MEVTRTSKLSGVTRTLDLPITMDQLIDYSRGALIQDAFWNLSVSEREFFMTGITDEEWQQFIAATEDMEEEDDLSDYSEPNNNNSFQDSYDDSSDEF